jgi:hypothetical protein
MEPVYGNRSNLLDRLRPVFEGLYEFYRNAPQEKG